MSRLRLISFKLCPFVQRAVIALELKNQSYEVKYIDLADKPEWFLKISPLGKVPVLQVDDDVIFESSVISEYLDETLPPQLHPMAPLRRAQHRAWIEYGSELLGIQFRLGRADSEDDVHARRDELRDHLARIAGELEDGPYFEGKDPSLVDAAMAPLFMRSAILRRRFDIDTLPADDRLARWRDAVLELEAVKHSVVDDFEERYVAHVESGGVMSATA